MSIPPLTGSATFYDWYITTNDIISELNSIGVYGATSGDGVKLDVNPSTKILTGTIGGTSGNIVSGLTFSGKVSFTGEVVVPNVSFKITGITSGTSGYTFGSVIRPDGAGYTLAQANDPDNAETLGVLSALNSTYSVVTVLGKISGNFNSVAGGSLSAGCVYFLNPSVAGGITSEEPITVGQVSKPVILGLDSSTGLVVQYRGNYLNGSSTLGLSGGNRVYVILPSASSSNGFVPGQFVSYLPSSTGIGSKGASFDSYLVATGRTAYDGWFLSTSTSLTEPSPIPFEEDFVVGMIETSASYGGNNIYQVVTKGISEILPSAMTPSVYGWWTLSGATLPDQLQLSNSNLEEHFQYERIYVGYNYNDTSFVVDIKPQIRALMNPSSTTLPTRSTSSIGTITNETFNGDFEVWQRSSGKDSQYTASGDFYFADQWVKRQSTITGTSSQYIQRQNFSNSQINVEGSPKHYIDLKCLADSGASFSNLECSVGHIIPEIEALNNNDITISFYAKCSQNNYDVDVYFARYSGGSLVEKNVIETISPTTSWNKYTFNYDVPQLTAGSYSDDYVEIGIDIAPLVEEAYDASVAVGTSLFVSIASLCVYNGSYLSPKHLFEPYEIKLSKARRFYHTTYSDSQVTASQTLTSDGDIALNAVTTQITPTTSTSTGVFPIEMYRSPTLTVYSSYTGVSNEVYNVTAGKDLRSTTGTIGYNRKTRIAPLGTPTISTTSDVTGYKVNILQGIVPYDIVSYHIVADASYSL